MSRSWIVGVKITTIGDGAVERAGTLTDARYRLASEVPTFDTSNLYRSVLAAYTSEIGHEVDWQTGEVNIGGMSLSLLGTAEVLGWLARVSFSRLTTLSTVLNASGQTVVLAGQRSEDETITIGREAICLGSETGSGPYTYSTSERGALGTTAYAHGTGDNDDIEVFAMGESPVHDLMVEVFRVPPGGTYTDEGVVWTGVVKNINWSGTSGLLTVSCDSAFDLMQKAKICKDLWRAPLLVAGGGYAFYAGKPGKVPPFDSGEEVALFSDGDRIWKGTLEGSDAAGWATRVGHHAGRVYEAWAKGEAVLTASGSPPRIEDPPAEIWQVFSTYYGAPDLDGSGSTLSPNPVTLALQLLTTTDHGENGAYDLGFADLGIGLLASLFDFADAEETASRLGELGHELRQIHFPFDGKPFDVVELVRDKILLPFGLALVPGPGGKLTIRGLQDAAVNSTSIGEADLVEPPEVQLRGVPAVDSTTVMWNGRPGVDPQTDGYVDDFNRERSVSTTGVTLEIDAGGVDDPETAFGIGVDFTSRYHFPTPIISLIAKKSLDLVLGDVVSLTHRMVPGRTGAKGLVDEIGIISRREEDLASGTFRYEMWWTSASIAEARRIAPSARVISESGGVVTVEANAFAPVGYTATINGIGYTTDAGIFEGVKDNGGGATLFLVIRDSDLSQRGTCQMTAASGSGNTMTITAASVTPVVGDILELESYDTVADAERGRYAYQADANETLGAGNDDAHEWVS